MKKVPFEQQPETERNNKLVKLYNTGFYSFNSLARMFKITPQRIHQIIKKHRKEVGGVECPMHGLDYKDTCTRCEDCKEQNG